MPAEDEQDRANEETLPDTPLRAYKDGREEDVEGDLDKLKSSDAGDSQRKDISEGGEESNFPEHEKH